MAGTLAIIAPASTRGAEIRLHSQCVPAGAMVTLGDVAEVVTATPSADATVRPTAADPSLDQSVEPAPATDAANRVATVRLFPSPPAGQVRYLRVRELQDLLVLKGVNLSDHHLSGSSQVKIVGDDAPDIDAPSEPPSFSRQRRANRRASDAITTLLTEYVAADTPWHVEATIEPADTRLVADPTHPVRARGGKEPWVGPQRFELSVQTSQGVVRVPVTAQVTIPDAVVVAKHSMTRGTLVRPSDVELRHDIKRINDEKWFHEVETVVGMETKQSIPAGRVINADMLQAPLWVRRGEVVTVYSRATGIRVRTQGRARDEGARGELVMIESLQDRKTYCACVCGIREVEVYARSAKAGADSSPLARY